MYPESRTHTNLQKRCAVLFCVYMQGETDINTRYFLLSQIDII